MGRQAVPRRAATARSGRSRQRAEAAGRGSGARQRAAGAGAGRRSAGAARLVERRASHHVERRRDELDLHPEVAPLVVLRRASGEGGRFGMVVVVMVGGRGVAWPPCGTRRLRGARARGRCGTHLRRGELSALEQRRADGVDALVVEARHLDVRADLDRGGREPLANVVEDGLPQVGVEACAGDEEGWPRRRRVRRGRKGGGEGRGGARRAEDEAPRTGERRSRARRRRGGGRARGRRARGREGEHRAWSPR